MILDLEGCTAVGLNQPCFKIWARRQYLKGYFKSLCKAIKMKPQKCTFWDDMWVMPWHRQTALHTTGTSAVQFIITSNITVHYLELMNSAYINIFSCKHINIEEAVRVTQSWFKPASCEVSKIERGKTQ